MKTLITAAFLMYAFITAAQPLAPKADPELISMTKDGSMQLTPAGASYFAKLSLDCTGKPYPHYYFEHELKGPEDLKPPEKMWPSFYGCFDWHSGVHNHWALVKLLKTYPNIPEAGAIRAKLDESFSAKNILVELAYLKAHEDESFEFPYGTSWLLKVADELAKWNDPAAQKWLANLKPLSDYIAEYYVRTWPSISEATYTGNHYASSLGLCFALDYAITIKNDELKDVVITSAKNFYMRVVHFPLEKEPFGYDFMSAGLLITDLMRRVLPQAEYVTWVKKFNADMFTVEGVQKVFAVEKKEVHTGYASHWDGFHLNRIWCINGMLESLPETAITPEVRAAWKSAQKQMWEYSQASIGKGNYDVDHWLSSFSVYALIGSK